MADASGWTDSTRRLHDETHALSSGTPWSTLVPSPPPHPPPSCHRYRLLLSNTTLLEVEPSRLPLPDSPSGDKEVSHVGIGLW